MSEFLDATKKRKILSILHFYKKEKEKEGREGVLFWGGEAAITNLVGLPSILLKLKIPFLPIFDRSWRYFHLMTGAAASCYDH